MGLQSLWLDMDTRCLLFLYLQQRVDNIKYACDVGMLMNINTQYVRRLCVRGDVAYFVDTILTTPSRANIGRFKQYNAYSAMCREHTGTLNARYSCEKKTCAFNWRILRFR